MSVFRADDFHDHESIHFFHDKDSGLKAIIAIHDRTMGPALGGTRMWPYASDEEALTDVLRLSRGMTYKSALARLPFGGGKAVILANAKTDKTPQLLSAYGDAVDQLGGAYITAEDVGVSPADMEIVAGRTKHVAGIAAGGAGDGDPSPATAWGVFHGIKAAVKHRLKRDTLSGLRVAVQGLGHVGWHLCRHLHDAGAKLIVADLNAAQTKKAARQFAATVVAPDEILSVEADVFAPCALGAILNDDTLSGLNVGIVAGSANNQLAEERHGDELRRRGILYAPDYVINAGGIINIAHEGPDYDREAAFAHCARIAETLADIFAEADAQDRSPHHIADDLAERLIAEKKRAAQPLKLAV